MRLRMWTYDLAREQSPSYEHLRRMLETTRAGGYNAFGLYLEHRFAYASAPWVAGKGAVTPDMVVALENEFADIEIVPFVNLLGHFEGFLYTEQGRRYREEPFRGLQACPSCPEFVELAHNLLDDVMKVFSSNLIHIGGDETWQLGKCPRCAAKMAEEDSSSATEEPPQAIMPGGEVPVGPSMLTFLTGLSNSVTRAEPDPKARLYGEHFGPLARRVVEAGRRPGLWGDMFLQHPSALAYVPQESLIFDWQYFKSPRESSRTFVQQGFEVVCCPSIQTYNAVWCHLAESEQNVREAAAAARELQAEGVCVTTWEGGLFGNYETILPVVERFGGLLDGVGGGDKADGIGGLGGTDGTDLSASSIPSTPSLTSGPSSPWEHTMGVDLPKLGGVFGHSQTRNGLRCRMLLYANPFLAWLHCYEELAGPIGVEALKLLDHAMQLAETPSERGVTQFAIKAVEFVRYADQARQAYAQALPGVAIASLAPCRQIFEDLEKIAVAAQINIGGSVADIHRCRGAKEAVERAIRRIKEFGDGSLGYLPAFEVLTHPNFIPHDQACWWLINSWARE